VKNNYSPLKSKKAFEIGIYFSFTFFTLIVLLMIIGMILENNLSVEAIIATVFFLLCDLFFLYVIRYRVRINGTQLIISRLFRKKVVIEFRNIRRKIEMRVMKPRLGIEFIKVYISTNEKKYVINYTNKEFVDYLVKSGFKIE
jgi:Ca2+/Na+ antiporter